MLSRTLVAPRPVSFVTILLVALSLLLAPLPANAAKGTDINPSVTSLLTTVSPGNTAAFVAKFQNTGSSTFTDVAFSATVTNGTVSGAPAGCTSTTTSVHCPLGKVDAGTSEIVLNFLVEAGSGGSDLVLAGTFGGDSTSSRGAKRDTWERTAAIPVENDVNVFARWQQSHGGEVEFPAVGTDAFQRSTVKAVAGITNAYAAYVSQRDAAIDCATGSDYAGFGLALDVTVNDGGSPISVEIRYAPAALGNTPPTQIGLVHRLNDGSCGLLVRAPVAGCTHPVGCFEVTTEGRGRNQVVIVTAFLPSNGFIKGI